MKDNIKAIKNNGHPFTISKNPSMDKDSDCWSNLWQRIKAQYSRLSKSKKQ